MFYCNTCTLKRSSPSSGSPSRKKQFKQTVTLDTLLSFYLYSDVDYIKYIIEILKDSNHYDSQRCWVHYEGDYRLFIETHFDTWFGFVGTKKPHLYQSFKESVLEELLPHTQFFAH